MKRVLSLIIALLFFTLFSTVFAQGYTLNISPTSGPPGTNVTLSPNPTYADERCFANGAATGRNYTVPGGASGTITFYCEAGTGEFYSRTNDATFTVTQPDSDGDGIPDSQDACPNQHFQGGNGCPPQEPDPQPQQPPQQPDQPAPDRDGDGIPDSQDACPDQHFQGGNGCPPQEPAEPQPVEPDIPQIILPDLPADDEDCQLATEGPFLGNVRDSFSETAEIVGQIEPENLYLVQAQANLVDERTPDAPPELWFKVDIGWVAGWIARTGGDCDDLPDAVLLTGGERGERPDICANEPFVVLFEGFTDANRAELWDSVEWQVDQAEIIITERIYIGTECDEIIFGTDQTEVIDGQGGNDIIFGFGGDDVLLGNRGDDAIYGGDGDDLVLGAAGNDRLHGGNGDDRLTGGEGNDSLVGGSGDDQLIGGSGNDSLLGDAGDDRLMGGDGRDVLWSGIGNDRLSGGNGNDIIHVTVVGLDQASGDAGNDRLTYRDHDFVAFGDIEDGSYLRGGEGDDTLSDESSVATGNQRMPLYGGPGEDFIQGMEIYGEGGSDDMRLRPTKDDLGWAYGGDGDDVIIAMGCDQFLDVDLCLALGSVDDPLNTDSNIDAYDNLLMVGGPGNDRISGSQSTNYIFGGSGDDYAIGFYSGDYIEGNDGDDELYGSWESFIQGINDDIPSYIIGGSGADIINGGLSRQDTCITDGADTVRSCERSERLTSWERYLELYFGLTEDNLAPLRE